MTGWFSDAIHRWIIFIFSCVNHTRRPSEEAENSDQLHLILASVALLLFSYPLEWDIKFLSRHPFVPLWLPLRSDKGETLVSLDVLLDNLSTAKDSSAILSNLWNVCFCPTPQARRGHFMAMILDCPLFAWCDFLALWGSTPVIISHHCRTIRI